ncbi:hypothetical protein EAS62_14550 [Bradyrhizobium zhanjiangense]|uniref:Major facilitator superfamily (MFS) profile domain-containing protein n=1 Tax=Bradyrhizobium zhanjiangense TaxID=1325107 RepID=A0ABY0DMP3_9BRAD|nr:hypothetical protein EAS62_14550 [Bradyrhizobium zhanjiangense]
MVGTAQVRLCPPYDSGLAEWVRQAAQIYLFILLAANAVGAFLGGPLGDRFGRKIAIPAQAAAARALTHPLSPCCGFTHR